MSSPYVKSRAGRFLLMSVHKLTRACGKVGRGLFISLPYTSVRKPDPQRGGAASVDGGGCFVKLGERMAVSLTLS